MSRSSELTKELNKLKALAEAKRIELREIRQRLYEVRDERQALCSHPRQHTVHDAEFPGQTQIFCKRCLKLLSSAGIQVPKIDPVTEAVLAPVLEPEVIRDPDFEIVKKVRKVLPVQMVHTWAGDLPLKTLATRVWHESTNTDISFDAFVPIFLKAMRIPEKTIYWGHGITVRQFCGSKLSTFNNTMWEQRDEASQINSARRAIGLPSVAGTVARLVVDVRKRDKRTSWSTVK